MADLDPRRALDATEGERPTPEFVESLRQTLEAELAAQSDGTRAVTSDVSVIDAVLEPHDEEQAMSSKWRVPTLIGAAAAIIIVVVGVIAITDDDETDDVDIDTVGQQEVDDGVEGDGQTTGDGTVDEPEETTPAEPAAPDTIPPDPWAFEITYIEVPAANSVAANEDLAWIANGGGTLSKIDLETNAVIASYEIPAGAEGTYFGFGSVWFDNADGTLSRFDPETETVVATIPLGGTSGWAEAGEDSMWATNGIGGQAVRIDPTTNTVVASIDIGGWASTIKENARGVWIRDAVGTVTRIDPATNTVVATIDTPSGGGSFMAGPEAGWAPGGSSGSVYRIDPDTNTVSAEVDISAAVGETVMMYGIHYAGDTIWVRYAYNCSETVCASDGVARIDPETSEVVAFADLRADWGRSGMAAGPTTAWTFSDDAIARFDF